MPARPAHERYASLSWLIVAMTVAALTIGAIATWYVESHFIVAAPIRGMLWMLAAAWVLIWLPMVVFALWSSSRLKSESARAQEVQAQAETAQATYRQLVEQARDVIYRTDAQGRFTFVNPTTSRITGYSEEELLGRRFIEFIRPDAREAAERFYGRQFVRKTPTTYYEFPALTKDGWDVWFGQNVQVLLEHDHVVGFHAVAREITTRRRAENELRSTTELLKALIQTSPLAILSVDHTSNITSWNRAAEEMLGWSESEVLGKPLPRVLAASEAEADALWEEALRGSGRTGIQVRRMRKDGTPVDLEVWTRTVRNEKGSPIACIGVLSDITERKRTEKAIEDSRQRLRESEARYRNLFEHNPLMYFTIDPHGTVLSVNPQGARQLGYSVEELVGRPVATVFPSDLHAGVQAQLDLCLQESTRIHTWETTKMRRDGTIMWVRETAVAVQDRSHGSSVLIMCEDITEHKRAEEALATSEKRLRTILDAEPECVKIVTGEGVLLDMNPAGLAMMEADSLEQVRGQSVCPIIAPPHRDAFIDFTRRVLRGEAGAMEYEIVGLKGTHRWLETHAVPLRDDHNVADSVLAITRDITARKRADKILQALLEGTASVTGEQFFAALVRALAGALEVRHALVTELVEGEPSGRLRMLAIWMGDRLGSPTEYDLVRTPCEKVIALGEAYYQHSVQELFPEDKDLVALGAVSYLGIALVSSAGKTIGHLCILDDKPLPDERRITPLLKLFASRAAAELERKQAEETQKKLIAQLAESRNRFEMVFRETPSAISITTVKEGRFLDVNKQAEVLTGYSREELLGRTTSEMNLYVDPAERSRVMEGLRKTGVLTNLERQIRTKSGELRTAIFSLVPVEMGSEPCLLAIAYDITERKRAEQGLRERSRQQAIEAELSLQAVTVQDLPTLLETAVKLVANALEADYCEALELPPNGGGLRLYASAGWKGDRIGQVRASEPGSLAHAALQSNKPVVRSLPADTQFGGPPWLRKHGAVGGMSVSIPGKDAPWGVLGVYTAGTRAFSRDDINFIQTVASILAATIERMETEGVLRSANQALRLLSRQLLQVQEDERRTIARDLHDEIGQSLTAIKLNVERAQRTSEQGARSRIMQDCIQIAERVLGQVRNLSLDLHPSILDDLGLTYALKWYADRLAERAGVRVEVTADPSLPRLSQDVEIACFRIAQEALTNVVRHAHATRADIILKGGAAAVELCVQDDGIGFPADKASSPSSVGLASMQERAKLLGGTIRIVSVPRGGTKVIATLPLLVASPARMPAEEVPRS